MAAEIIYDTIIAADLTVEAFAVKERQRTGMIVNMDVGTDTGVDPSLVLEGAAEAILAVHPWGERYSPTAPHVFSRLRVVPLGSNSVRFYMTYESPAVALGGSFGAFMYRVESITQSCRTNKIPGTHQVINTQFVDPNDASPPIDETPILFEFERACKVFSFNALIVGTPPGPLQNLACHVNDSEWAGLDVGYWKILRIGVDVTKFSGYYAVSGQAASKVIEDWSDFGILRNTETGRYAKVDQAEVTNVLSQSYSNDVVKGNGFVKVGLLPTTDFGVLFGTPPPGL